MSGSAVLTLHVRGGVKVAQSRFLTLLNRPIICKIVYLTGRVGMVDYLFVLHVFALGGKAMNDDRLYGYESMSADGSRCKHEHSDVHGAADCCLKRATQNIGDSTYGWCVVVRLVTGDSYSGFKVTGLTVAEERELQSWVEGFPANMDIKASAARIYAQ